jgi:protein-tyrosine phosphatase
LIDIHSHLLPGVDDGARTPEAAAAVLGRFRSDGVRLVVCTPHLRASRVGRAPVDGCAERLNRLRALAPDGPALAQGWEILLDEPGVDLRAPHLALGGSSAVLVELPRGLTGAHAAAELFRISMSGVVPVLAHAERYPAATPDVVREWRVAGAVIQVDAASLAGSGARGRLARSLVAEGLADVLASDNHGDGRSLGPARRWLADHGAEGQAALLTDTNPERLLRNERVVPVPPASVRAGALEQLRELLRGLALPAPLARGRARRAADADRLTE